MTYWALNALFLAVVGVVALAAALAARGRTRIRWGAVAITGAVVCAMTAVFDNIMIAVGLVGYSPDHISGALVGIAPLEDFAYAIAAVVLLPSLWALLGGRHSRLRATEVPGEPKNPRRPAGGIR